ncbi:MAG: hypothetical protein KJ906_01650 [Nanoarchaeota archaeon]|nr:hypothetical protein [Nanoarchaeota archaeon]
MRNPVAIGLFVISVMFGIALVILGTTMIIEFFVWIGMLVISLGIINLIIRITFPEPQTPVKIVVSEKVRTRKKKTLKTKKKKRQRKS